MWIDEHCGQSAGPLDEEEEAVDLEAAARDVWESGYRLADLSSQSSQEFRFQVQESLLHVLQRHIASLTPDQAQVPTSSPLSQFSEKAAQSQLCWEKGSGIRNGFKHCLKFGICCGLRCLAHPAWSWHRGMG